MSPGEQLRRIRLRLGLTAREVAARSRSIAARYENTAYLISHPRLVQMENSSSPSNIFKLFSLSAIYGISPERLFSLYCDISDLPRLHATLDVPATRISEFESATTGHRDSGNRVSVKESPLVTCEQGETVVARNDFLIHLQAPNRRLVLIGRSDDTMYPLIRPGSIVQMEETAKVCPATSYHREFDRPIYVIELRSGYLCSWCEIENGMLRSIPHPLSSRTMRQFAYPREAEVIGRVTAVLLRLDSGSELREVAAAAGSPASARTFS